MEYNSSKQREREIFFEAVRREDPTERVAYLENACGADDFHHRTHSAATLAAKINKERHDHRNRAG